MTPDEHHALESFAQMTYHYNPSWHRRAARACRIINAIALAGLMAGLGAIVLLYVGTAP